MRCGMQSQVAEPCGPTLRTMFHSNFLMQVTWPKEMGWIKSAVKIVHGSRGHRVHWIINRARVLNGEL